MTTQGDDISASTQPGDEPVEAVGESAAVGMAPPDLVSGTRDLSLTDLETDTDSTKDLDVVSVGGGNNPPANSSNNAATTPPELVDSPPEMPSTPPEMLGGEEDEEEADSSLNNHSTASDDDLELPDAPVSEPGSPQVSVQFVSSNCTRDGQGCGIIRIPI
jgi:hypothetical protein